MAEVLEAMGFPIEWCETALQSSSGLDSAVDLLLHWQTNGMPQHFGQAAPHSASEASSRGEQPASHSELSNNSSQPGGRAPTLKLAPLPGSKSKSAANEESTESPSSTLRTSSNGHSSLEASAGMKHPSPGDSPCSDAVVPDALAEQRNARYLAARREKQEKEATRERIRQQMREDMATRRSRQQDESLSAIDKGKSLMRAPEGEESGEERTSYQAPVHSNVELHVRCPWNQNLNGSFPASASLKVVRAYVEQQAKQRSLDGDFQEHGLGHSRGESSPVRPGAVPFSGWSASIADSMSSEKVEARELLKAARENHETRTRQIMESAKSFREGPSGTSQSHKDPRQARIYFLIPFPRKEFLTESAMDTTLAEAHLFPSGTLVVQYGVTEDDQRGGSAQNGGSCDLVSRRNGRNLRRNGARAHSPHHAASEGVKTLEVEGEQDRFREQALRALETEGERVRIREQALQAAAKRMSEAATIFRDGLPLGAGETGDEFHFPRDEENENLENLGTRSDPSSIRGSVAPPALGKAASSVCGPSGSAPSNNAKAGADAESSIARNTQGEGSRYPTNRVLDAPHMMAVAAAEQRLRNPQPVRAAEACGGQEERSQEENSPLQPRSRGRMSRVSELRPRPEKQQRTSNSSLPPALVPQGGSTNTILRNTSVQSLGCSSSRRPLPSPTDAERRAESLRAALQRCTEANEGENNGKGLEEDIVPVQESPPRSSIPAEQERSSTLRVRLEDGNVVSQTFPASTQLQFVRNSFTPDDAAFSDYGFVIPFPEPRFIEGDDLIVTLEDVGLVPRGTIHLTKVSSRGTVREGRRPSRRRGRHEDYEGFFRELPSERYLDESYTYEEMLGLEESIGRVHVGVPDEMVTRFPTWIVEEKPEVTLPNEDLEDGPDSSSEAAKEEFDLCTVCIAEMVPQEEVLSLPCLHIYHSSCIKKWLSQSTHCPTCKQSVV